MTAATWDEHNGRAKEGISIRTEEDCRELIGRSGVKEGVTYAWYSCSWVRICCVDSFLSFFHCFSIPLFCVGLGTLFELMDCKERGKLQMNEMRNLESEKRILSIQQSSGISPTYPLGRVR